MPRLTQAPNLVIATLWVDALKADGIDASVQRQYLGSAAGELHLVMTVEPSLFDCTNTNQPVKQFLENLFSW